MPLVTLDMISNPPFTYMGKYEAIWTKDLVVFQIMSLRVLFHTATDYFLEKRSIYRYRVAPEISSCWVNTTSRQGIKQLRNSFGSVSSIFQ